MQYYIPQTKWKGKNASAITDFTYRQTNNAICNISFIIDKSHPKTVSAVKFIADGNEYLIEKISPMFREYSAKLVRVSININEEYFKGILASNSIKLIAVIDGLEYEFSPPKAFMRMKNELYENLS